MTTCLCGHSFFPYRRRPPLFCQPMDEHATNYGSAPDDKHMYVHLQWQLMEVEAEVSAARLLPHPTPPSFPDAPYHPAKRTRVLILPTSGAGSTPGSTRGDTPYGAPGTHPPPMPLPASPSPPPKRGRIDLNHTRLASLVANLDPDTVDKAASPGRPGTYSYSYSCY